MHHARLPGGCAGICRPAKDERPCHPEGGKPEEGFYHKKTGILCAAKSFYDHIIRNEEDYHHIWQYIDTNPLQWALDCHHPDKERTT